jgi:hypothetical protein
MSMLINLKTGTIDVTLSLVHGLKVEQNKFLQTQKCVQQTL